jgi:hypothetical protein
LYRIFFILILFLLGTNKWMNPQQGRLYLQAGDIDFYMKIAEAAPLRPNSLMEFHHGQRFFSHYVIGILSKVFHLDLLLAYQLTAWLMMGLILWIAWKILDALKLQPNLKIFSIALLILNPYTFRYYLIVPTMASDLLFILGMAITTWGICQNRFEKIWFGMIIALLGRQSAVLALPGVALWNFVQYRKMKSVLFWASFGGLYLFILSWIKPFTTPATVGPFVGGLLILLNPLEYHHLPEHYVRAIISYFALIALMGMAFIYNKKPTLTFFACFLMAAGLIFQPMAGHYAVIGQNASRLGSLGFIPFWVALASIMKEIPLTHKRWFEGAFIFILMIGSLHHMYSIINHLNSLQFAWLELMTTLLAAGIYYFMIVCPGENRHN